MKGWEPGGHRGGEEYEEVIIKVQTSCSAPSVPLRCFSVGLYSCLKVREFPPVHDGIHGGFPYSRAGVWAEGLRRSHLAVAFSESSSRHTEGLWEKERFGGKGASGLKFVPRAPMSVPGTFS